MCKKNFIPISIGFCVIALQIYREILKRYKKGNKSAKITFLKYYCFRTLSEAKCSFVPTGFLIDRHFRIYISRDSQKIFSLIEHFSVFGASTGVTSLKQNCKNSS